MATQSNTNKNLEQAAEYNLIGTRYYRARQYRAAIDFFSKAIELNPTYTTAYYNRGWGRIKLDECWHHDPRLLSDAVSDLNTHLQLVNLHGLMGYDRYISDIEGNVSASTPIYQDEIILMQRTYPYTVPRCINPFIEKRRNRAKAKGNFYAK